MNERGLHILVVDDSAVVRETVTRLLRRLAGWQVSTAVDSVIALERIRRDRPDVVLLDLEMPRMDGLTLLRHIMATDPLPVVVCSGYADHGTAAALAALELGAVEIFPKPKLSVREFLEDSGAPLIETLRRAATAGSGLRRVWHPQGRRDVPSLVRGKPVTTRIREPEAGEVNATAPGHPGPPWEGPVVLLGASMGGTDVIRQVLSTFPEDGPPCLVVIHMPEPFTAAFAQRLDGQIAMCVDEAVGGEGLVAGRVLLAPGGRHMVVHATRDGPTVALLEEPPVRGHRPSVDRLFESAAEALGSRAVAALLTGMGEDGADGLLALRRAGARTLVQDEATSTVFGMPRAALERGAAERALPLEQIGERLIELACAPAATRDHKRHGTRGRRVGVGLHGGDEGR